MKVAAKVFTIIGMIVGFWYILPIIFGAITLKKLNTGEMSTGWKVCVLLFVNIVAGILLLCMPKEAPDPAAVDAPTAE